MRERWHISTIASDAPRLAHEHDLGLEIAEFCTPSNMDRDFVIWDAVVRKAIEGIREQTGLLTLHAPYGGLCPAEVDPLIVEVTRKRYEQAYALAQRYGADRLIVHSGYLPVLFFEEWFVEQSVDFWREFLHDKDDSVLITLENVFEPDPVIPAAIAREVDDPRMRLCLDLGHANCSGHATPASAWVDAFAPWLAHVHVHNNKGHRDEHLPPDQGTLDIPGLIGCIREKAPEASFTLECRDGAAGVDWLTHFYQSQSPS
ncbi:MAG: sugar phosphate isomerase/epimerase [Coriobacteriales bacterium]|jgi:sugar phosphate isomerase/epimerase|nr:sugar phosphate isomerase/epimerase [Coriobacteriales bacterium]